MVGLHERISVQTLERASMTRHGDAIARGSESLSLVHHMPYGVVWKPDLYSRRDTGLHKDSTELSAGSHARIIPRLEKRGLGKQKSILSNLAADPRASQQSNYA